MLLTLGSVFVLVGVVCFFAEAVARRSLTAAGFGFLALALLFWRVGW